MHVVMSDAEKALLWQFLSCSDDYVEFGAGGSTVLASTAVKRSIVSVDSSLEWLERVRAACLERGGGLMPKLVNVDLGKLGEWGWPLDETKKHLWPSYHTAVWSLPESAAADLYLVDGRFRVACFVQAARRARPDAVIGIHDFSGRAQYHVVHEIAREIARTGSLSFFVRRPDYDDKRAAEILDRHALQPA